MVDLQGCFELTIEQQLKKRAMGIEVDRLTEKDLPEVKKLIKELAYQLQIKDNIITALFKQGLN